MSERNDSQSQHLRPVALAALFVVTSLTGSLILMYAMIIATAIPSLTEYFGTIEDIDWYSTAYLFSLATIQPLTGKIYYLFPLKNVFLINIAIFEIGNITCATAKTSSIFIGGRAIAGIGAAGLFTGSLIMFFSAASIKIRNLLLAIGMTVTTVGGALGPTIGGAIIQRLGWRWCLWIFLPIHGAAAALLVFLRVPEQTAKGPARGLILKLPQKLDLPGFLLFAGASLMLMLGMSWGGQEYPWNSATIIGLFCGGVAVAVLFGIWTRYRRENALIPLQVITKPIVFVASMASFLQVGTFSTIAYYLPVWFQSVKSASPLDSGLMILPTMITQILATIIVSGIMTKFPKANKVPPWAMTGNICNAVASGLITTFVPSASEGTWIGYQVLVGVGRGFAIQMPLIALRNQLLPAEISQGIAMTVFFQYFGSTIFLSISKSIFLNVLQSALNEYAPGVDPKTVINSGATAVLNGISAEDAAGVIKAYNKALVTVFWLPMAGSTLAIVTSFGLGKYRLKQEDEMKDDDAGIEKQEKEANMISSDEISKQDEHGEKK